MSGTPPLALAAQALAMAGLGLAIGLAYFGALRRSVALLAAGGGWLGPFALAVARLGAMMLCLIVIARFGGAVSLLASFAGFLLSRQVALRAARRTS